MTTSAKSRYLLACIMACVFCADAYSRQVIEVMSQSRFDSLSYIIGRQLEAGERDVCIRLAAKRFKFSENHIVLKDVAYPKSSVTVSGEEGTVIYSEGMGYTRGDKYAYAFNHQNTFLDENLQELPIWSESMIARDTIRVIDRSFGKCFIPYRGLEPQSGKLCRYTYVSVTMWFTSSIYKVSEITDEGVCFECTDLNDDNWLKTYNVNLDYAYTKHCNVPIQMPRFRLCNTLFAPNSIADGRIKSEKRRLHECRNTTFVSLEGCKLRSFNIDGICFNGNAGNWNKYLIQVSDCRFTKGLNITGNSFRYLKSLAVCVKGTDNLTFQDNKAIFCSSGIVRSCNDCMNTKILGNRFEQCGTGMTNIPLVQTVGTGFLVKGNILSDFGYSGLNSGVFWGDEMKHRCSGIIEDNELYYTDITLDDIEKRTLIDSGAIYVSTQNYKTVIRNNYIHDYRGIWDYRGIYMDDGANNCHVYGNKVRNTPTAYSIQFSTQGKDGVPGNKSPYFCTGNMETDNDCDGKIYLKRQE
ncbi:MAG: right-handed parallel beta-helix repeat-containing protein [Bacteroidaceae bacterium]|nr:right-handed parallel beta-helix repeat-containing protein [Bacteroidaceae bacterium]